MSRIIIYYSTIREFWTQPRYESLSLQVPSGIRKRISLYKDSMSQQCRLTGKLQLLQLLKDFKLNEGITLDQLCYSETNRPYFSSGLNFDFNISHSGRMVICGAGINVRLGLDTEEIKPFDLQDFKSELSPEEWERISDSENIEAEFYRHWTRKEALLKAAGVGLVKETSIDYKKKFYLKELKISGDYVAHIAVSDDNAEIVLREFSLE